MEQSWVICPGGRMFPSRQASGDGSADRQGGYGAVLRPRGPALGALGRAARGVLGAEVSCDCRQADTEGSWFPPSHAPRLGMGMLGGAPG